VSRLSDNAFAYDTPNLRVSRGPRSNVDLGERRSLQQCSQSLYPSERDVAELRMLEFSSDRLIERLRNEKNSPRSHSPEMWTHSRPTLHALADDPSLPTGLDAKRQRHLASAWNEADRREKMYRKEPPGAFSHSSNYTTSLMDPPSIQFSDCSASQSSDDSSGFEDCFQNLPELHESTWNAQSSHACCSGRRYHKERHPPTSSQVFRSSIEIEVSPGCFMPLRGSVETMHAIQNGDAHIAQCLLCNESLTCVPDCILVVCPDCRVLSPVEDNPHHRSNLGERSRHVYHEVRRGVGLGVKM